jgi:outer membrane lipoprotein-sorting protein
MEIETDENSGEPVSVLKAVGFESAPNTEFLDRLRERSLAAFEDAPAEYPRPAPGRLDGTWRTFVKSRLFKMAAAAAVVAIMAIGAIQFVGEMSAYAQIVKEIKNVRTMTYTLIRQANTGTGETIKIEVEYKEPGFLRTKTVDGCTAILDGNTHKMISIVPQGWYTIGDLESLNKTHKSPLADMEALKALPTKADLRLASKSIDGVKCDGYQVTQGDMTTVVWLDTKTGNVVQIEHKYASAPGMNTIMKNIKLDVPLEDSLFSLIPPAGYKKLGGTIKGDSSAQTEEKFIEWLRWWANANVDHTFPPMVAGSEIAKVMMDMLKQGKFKREALNNITPQPMLNALLFVATLPKESNWRYAGNGVKMNAPHKAIFWYRPAGKELYRVIHSDLTVRELPEGQVPK